MKYLFFLALVVTNLAVASGYQFNSNTKFKGSELHEISLELKKVRLIEFDLTRVGKLKPFLFDQIFVDATDSSNFAVVVLDLFNPERLLRLSGKQLVLSCRNKKWQNICGLFF